MRASLKTCRTASTSIRSLELDSPKSGPCPSHHVVAAVNSHRYLLITVREMIVIAPNTIDINSRPMCRRQINSCGGFFPNKTTPKKTPLSHPLWPDYIGHYFCLGRLPECGQVRIREGRQDDSMVDVISEAGNKYTAAQRIRPSQLCSDRGSACDGFLPTFLLILSLFFFFGREVTSSPPLVALHKGCSCHFAH